MNRRFRIIAATLWVVALAPGAGPGASAKQLVLFGGGPAGGTFQIVASAIQSFKPVKDIAEFTIKAQATGGSKENLIMTDDGQVQFSTVYSGELWQGRNGMLPKDSRKYENVLAVADLYGAPAQLIVKKSSGITSVKGLVGKKVGVGNAGSGAFVNCEQFFKYMGIWDKIERYTMGYNDAAAAFVGNQLDAFWLFTAFPSGAVIMAAQTDAIELVDLAADAGPSGYLDKYSYLSPLTIPANTYRGVDHPVGSFQDSALWVANAKVSDDVVYKLLSLIFTKEGLAHMVSQKKTFQQMGIAGGVTGIVTPMHPGAVRFWKEKGVLK
jgi:uncharacterized protein